MPGHKGNRRAQEWGSRKSPRGSLAPGQQGSSRQIPTLKGTLYKDIRLYAAAKAVKMLQDGILGFAGAALKVSEVVGQAETIQAELRGWIESYEEREYTPGLGFELFKYHWRILRVWVPLQLRLCVEQVLQDMGKPWNTLITGFRPID